MEIMKKSRKRLTLSITGGLLLSSLLLPSAFAKFPTDGSVVSNGLTWTRNNSTVASSGKSTWSVAKSTCDNLNAGGYTDWRLPTNAELNALDKGLLKSAGWTIDYNWSETPALGSSGNGYHYMKYLGDGGYLMQVGDNHDNYVSCVR